MYSITSLSKITGIPSNTLRSWERRYGIPAPHRDEAGVRVYTAEDVTHVSLIGRLVRRGHPIGKLTGLSHADLLLLDSDVIASDGDSREILRKRLFEAIAEADVARYRTLLARALVACAPAEACAHVIAPALREIGRLWECGKLDIAVEHAFSEITKQLLFASANTMQWSPTRSSLAFATLPGERHELGALMAYVIASAQGYQATYFGPDIPWSSLSAAVDAVKARVLVLSIVAPSNVDEVSREIMRLAETLRPGMELWLGTAFSLDVGDTGILLFDCFETFDRHLIAFG